MEGSRPVRSASAIIILVRRALVLLIVPSQLWGREKEISSAVRLAAQVGVRACQWRALSGWQLTFLRNLQFQRKAGHSAIPEGERLLFDVASGEG